MSRTDEILDQIRDAVEDWTVSSDAMRCAPEPHPVRAALAVPFTGRAAARAVVVRRLVDQHDLTPDAAWSAIRAAENGEPTPHLELISAEARAAAAEAVQHLGQAVTAFMRALQPALQAAAAAMKQIDEAFRTAGYHAPGEPTRRRDRPAWQSPYGPPQKGRR